MACFLCSASISAEEASEPISLSRIFSFLKLNYLSSVKATCCEDCSQVCSNLTNLISEMEVVKMKIRNSISDFKESIAFKITDRHNLIVDHQYILKKTKEHCLKYLRAQGQPTVILKRINSQEEDIQLSKPIQEPNESSSSSSTSVCSEVRRGHFSCHFCSYLKIQPKFDSTEELNRHKLVAHVHQIFGKSRPKKLHLTDYRKCLDDFIENEVISTTRRVRDKKFSVCICNYCPPNTRKYLNQNTMYFHLMEYHRLEITRKLEMALYDLMEEDEEEMSDDESMATGNKIIKNGKKRLRNTISSSDNDQDIDDQSDKNFLKRKPKRKRRTLRRRNSVNYLNNKIASSSSSDDEQERIRRKKQNGRKRKAQKLMSSSSSSSQTLSSLQISSSSSSSSSSKFSSKPQKSPDDPNLPSNKSDSIFSVIPSDRKRTRRKLNF